MSTPSTLFLDKVGLKAAAVSVVVTDEQGLSTRVVVREAGAWVVPEVEVAEAGGGCRCAAPGGGAGWAWLGLLVVGVARRRRR